jgi:hypothetical protein
MCKYCSREDNEFCTKPIVAPKYSSGPLFLCTRTLGHDGPCVACGIITHNITDVK